MSTYALSLHLPVATVVKINEKLVSIRCPLHIITDYLRLLYSFIIFSVFFRARRAAQKVAEIKCVDGTHHDEPPIGTHALPHPIW